MKDRLTDWMPFAAAAYGTTDSLSDSMQRGPNIPGSLWGVEGRRGRSDLHSVPTTIPSAVGCVGGISVNFLSCVTPVAAVNERRVATPEQASVRASSGVESSGVAAKLDVI